MLVVSKPLGPRHSYLPLVPVIRYCVSQSNSLNIEYFTAEMSNLKCISEFVVSALKVLVSIIIYISNDHGQHKTGLVSVLFLLSDPQSEDLEYILTVD